VRLLLILVPLVLAGCGGGGGGGGSSAPEGGGILFGTVSGGPGGACPSQEGPCSIPASGVTITFSHGSLTIAAKADAKGHYRVRLPAGRYSVEGPQLLKPRHVEVSAGDSRRVNFSVDTKVS
jgi:hypothetical protein